MMCLAKYLNRSTIQAFETTRFRSDNKQHQKIMKKNFLFDSFNHQYNILFFRVVILHKNNFVCVCANLPPATDIFSVSGVVNVGLYV